MDLIPVDHDPFDGNGVILQPVDHDPFADFRPSTNVEDYRNEGELQKLSQQFSYQIQKLREDPIKFILHGGNSFGNTKPQYPGGYETNDGVNLLPVDYDPFASQ